MKGTIIWYTSYNIEYGKYFCLVLLSCISLKSIVRRVLLRLELDRCMDIIVLKINTRVDQGLSIGALYVIRMEAHE